MPGPPSLWYWTMLHLSLLWPQDKQTTHPPCSWITPARCWGFRAWKFLQFCNRSLGHGRDPHGNLLWYLCLPLQTGHAPIFTSALTLSSWAPFSVPIFCLHSSLEEVSIPLLLGYLADKGLQRVPSCPRYEKGTLRFKVAKGYIMVQGMEAVPRSSVFGRNMTK